jgi:hypothetical protein
MTRAELNTYVDTEVTNKTVVNSLSPTNEGNAIKAVADYVDENKEDFENKSTDVETDGASDVKYPSVKAVKDYVDANLGPTASTEGIIQGNSSQPYNQTTFDITTTSPSLFNTRLVLPENTPQIGKIYIVRNIGTAPIIIRTSQFSGGGFYFDGSEDTIEEFSIRPNITAYFTYVGGGYFIVNLSQNEIQEYNEYLFQSGTDNISGQSAFFDNLTRELGVDKYLRITYARLGVGDYEVRITFKGLIYSTNAFSVSFNDSTCRIYSITNSSLGGGVQRKTFAFKTYTPSGILSDDQLIGSNGSQITIKYYK